MRNSLLLTGASQPACDNFVFWKDVTRMITHLRLGERFARNIDQCSESFNRQVNLVKRNRMQLITHLCSHFGKLACDKSEIQDEEKAQVDRLYDEIVVANRLEVERDFSDVTEISKILCLAINGYSLTLVPSCLRCQRMYSGWNHWEDHRAPAKTTKDAQEKIEFISKQ